MARKVVTDLDVRGVLTVGGLPISSSGGTSGPPTLRKAATFYAWPSTVNGYYGTTQAEQAAAWYSNYDDVIFPDGICDPAHGDHAATQMIANLLKTKYNTRVWGYVTTTVDQTGTAYPAKTAQVKIAEWGDMGVHGVFLDEYGFDYGTPVNNRARQNTLVDAIHAEGMFAILNAWVVDDAFDPAHGPVSAGPGDVFYLESFTYNQTGYAGGWSDIWAMANRITDMQAYRDTLGVSYWCGNMMPRTGTLAAGMTPALRAQIIRQCEAAARIFRADALLIDGYEYSAYNAGTNYTDANLIDPIPFVFEDTPVIENGIWTHDYGVSVRVDDLGLKMEHTAAPAVYKVTEVDRQPMLLRRDALVPGTNVTVTDNGNGTLTIAGTGGGGGASTLDALTDVSAPSSTPVGKVLGTTATGTWGPIDSSVGAPIVSPTAPASPAYGQIWIQYP